jgi:ATP-binding cassette subfamily B protein
VDVRTEAAILEALERLLLGRTAFIIAHRASTLRECDILLRIDHGTLVVETIGLPRVSDEELFARKHNSLR